MFGLESYRKILKKIKEGNYEHLHEDLTDIFNDIRKNKKVPKKPFNYEFMKIIQQHWPIILEKVGTINSVPPPEELDEWLTSLLREEYKRWVEDHKQNHIFSYFIVAQQGIIGTLGAECEEDEKNVPPNHVRGQNYPTYISKVYKLVYYYLVTKLKIPRDKVSQAMSHIVIHWEDSLASQFDVIQGDSLSFVMAALFFNCTLRRLTQEGTITITNHEGKQLSCINIQPPLDTVMSGNFLYSEVPPIDKISDTFQDIPVVEVTHIPEKINLALGVNKIQPTFNNFLLPAKTQLPNDDFLNKPYRFEGQGIYGSTQVTLRPISSLDDFFQTLFPWSIVVDSRLTGGTENSSITPPVVKKTGVKSAYFKTKHKVLIILFFFALISFGAWGGHRFSGRTENEGNQDLTEHQVPQPDQGKISQQTSIDTKIITREESNKLSEIQRALDKIFKKVGAKRTPYSQPTDFIQEIVRAQRDTVRISVILGTKIPLQWQKNFDHLHQLPVQKEVTLLELQQCINNIHKVLFGTIILEPNKSLDKQIVPIYDRKTLQSKISRLIREWRWLNESERELFPKMKIISDAEDRPTACLKYKKALNEYHTNYCKQKDLKNFCLALKEVIEALD